jgi:hypothetical protein
MFDIELYVHKTSVGISIKNKSKSEASFFIKEFFINFSEIKNKNSIITILKMFFEESKFVMKP